MRALLSAVLCVTAAVPARAGIVVQPAVPFTEVQLAAVIAVRGGSGESALDIEVSRLSPERLVLVTPDGRWEIEIGAATGAAAARIVALHVLELAVPSATARSAAIAELPVTRAELPMTRADRPLSASPRARDRLRLTALGLGSAGTRARDFVLVGGTVELSRVGRWVAGGGIAVQHGLTIDNAPGAPISADLIRARVVGGVAVGMTELVAGGFAGRVIVDGGTGGIARWTTGLVAEARVALPVSGPWSVVIEAGGELFREQIEVRLGGTRVGETPRTTLGAGLGLAWTERPAR
jgi:hypothetical protein